MGEIRVPLESADVEKIVKASAHLNQAYLRCTNILAALTSEDSPDLLAARAQLLTLDVDRKTLGDIRTAVQEHPYLTEEQLADILALQNTLPDDMFDQIASLRRKIEIKRQEATVPELDADVAHSMTHQGVGALHRATRAMQDMFDMVNKKARPLGLINVDRDPLEGKRIV